MEFFDVVDQNRKPLNKILPRGSKLQENEFNQGAEIWIVNKNNEFLISQRSLNKSHPNLWECPGGCSIAGKNTLQTIKREILEEIGINLNNQEPSYIDTKLYKTQFVDIYFIRLNNLNLNDLTLQKDEVQNAKFVSTSTIEDMINKKELVQSVVERYYYVKDKLNKYINNNSNLE